MNILYKYCDQDGIKIIESLELKLPYITEVNDPLECLPFFYCPEDKSAIKVIERRYLSACTRRKIIPSKDYKQKLHEQFETGEIQKKLIESQQKLQKEWNQRKGCLLSVSKTPIETVMWAHYAEKHSGIVIGIDFNVIHHVSMKMNPVNYSQERPKINILEEPEGDISVEAYRKVIMTKSSSWEYEKEFRTIFLVDALEKLQKYGLSCLKNFKGKNTWFLRLNPDSIREVIFGLYTEDSLKFEIKNLIEKTELQHVKLFQAEESETYTLNLVEVKN